MQLIIFIQQYRTILVGVVFAGIFIWEHKIPQRKFSGLLIHNIQNIGYGLINVLISFGGGYYFSKYLDYVQQLHFGLLNQFQSNWTILIGFIIADILMYWWHRLNHISPFFWRFHALHHRDEKMNSTTAIRFHVVELILSYLFRAIFYPLFGIGSLTLLVFSTVHFIMIIFHHSNIYINSKVDRFIRIFITSPEMHRIHHSNKWNETNSNYTSILACWDWLFLSYIRKPAEEINFGIPDSGNKSGNM